MLGGDDDDDLAALVEACSNQVDRPPDLMDKEDSRTRASTPQKTPGQPAEVGGAKGVDPTIRALLEQNTQLMAMVRQSQGQGGNLQKGRSDVRSPMLLRNR